MKTFKAFLGESKNTHLQHLEDIIFISGAKGIDVAISVIREVVKVLQGSSKTKTFVSVKWDGAPALVCGEDPVSKKFFVATKSLFNKTPKVNFTHKDIDTNHGGSGVAAKLHAALDHLKPLGIKGILQGDLMFTPGDVKTKNIDGKPHYIFQPNTIIYAVPTDSELGRRISGAGVGIVFHTQYKGASLTQLSASFGPNVGYLKNSQTVWVEDAAFTDATGVASLTASETEKLSALLDEIVALKADKTITSALNTIQRDAVLFDLVTRYFNSIIRSGSDLGSVPGLIKFMSEQPKPNQAAISRVRGIASGLKRAFDLHKRIAVAKSTIIAKMNQVKTIGAFFQTDTGFVVANPEGFVAVATKGVYKLVDRLEFSRQNFNAVKNWG